VAVHDDAVLEVDVLAEGDRGDVPADHAPEPQVHPGAAGDVPGDHRGRGEEDGVGRSHRMAAGVRARRVLSYARRAGGVSPLLCPAAMSRRVPTGGLRPPLARRPMRTTALVFPFDLFG